MSQTQGMDNFLSTPKVICPKCSTKIQVSKRLTRIGQDFSVAACAVNVPVLNLPGLAVSIGVAAAFNVVGTVKSSLFLSTIKCPSCNHVFPCKDFH